MREASKARLDRLQAELVARTGRKLTQEELLDELVSLGESEKDRLMGGFGKPRTADETWQRMLSCIGPAGGKRIRPEDIDRIVYLGEEP